MMGGELNIYILLCNAVIRFFFNNFKDDLVDNAFHYYILLNCYILLKTYLRYNYRAHNAFFMFFSIDANELNFLFSSKVGMYVGCLEKIAM